MPVLTRVPQGKPRVPPNPVFSSDLGHLFFVTVKYDVFFFYKKGNLALAPWHQSYFSNDQMGGYAPSPGPMVMKHVS